MPIDYQEPTDQNTTNGGMIMKKQMSKNNNDELDKKRKISLKSKQNVKASRNITLMVIFQCFLYIFGK